MYKLELLADYGLGRKYGVYFETQKHLRIQEMVKIMQEMEVQGKEITLEAVNNYYPVEKVYIGEFYPVMDEYGFMQNYFKSYFTGEVLPGNQEHIACTWLMKQYYNTKYGVTA